MTIREIANLAGVSPAAVSLVINKKKGVSDETRQRVLSVIEEHNYMVPGQKRSSKPKRFRLCSPNFHLKFLKMKNYLRELKKFMRRKRNTSLMMSKKCFWMRPTRVL